MRIVIVSYIRYLYRWRQDGKAAGMDKSPVSVFEEVGNGHVGWEWTCMFGGDIKS